MPNAINGSGLTVATGSEVIALYTGSFQAIYGASVNLGPETPDGQWIMTLVQSVLDLEDLLVQINAMFDPDQAVGVILDQRVAINGIQRQAGTFTVVSISVVTSQSVNLYGLDQTAFAVYTVSDNAGNQYELQTTQLGLTTGTHSLLFQAASPGAITPLPNTITVPVTIVLGVTSVNNPAAATVVGLNEETDAALRIRRQKSVSLASQGYLAGLLAALENIPGVSFAAVYENTSGTTIGSGPLTGLPGHSIWVIVAGSGSASAIGSAIYLKRNAGCGMYNSGDGGAQSYNVTQVDGTTFTVYWDDVVEVPLFTRFTVASLNGSTPPNIPGIVGSLPLIFLPGVYGQVNANEVATLVQEIDPNTLVSSVGFATTVGSPYVNPLTPAAANDQFSVAGSDVIVIPMYITSPQTILTVTSSGASVTAACAVAKSGSQTFVANGGFPIYTWAISVNNSGGSINGSTGAYVAGTTAGVDTVKVYDSFPASQGGSYSAVVAVTVS